MNIPPTIQLLNPPESYHLLAAQGWVELGNYHEANKELENITASLRVHPHVLEVRLDIYSHARNWAVCVDLATALINFAPDDPSGWVQRSYALHELKRTQDAFDLLRPVVGRFRREWLIPYNLACYCTQLGRMKEAEQWFKHAMTLDEDSVKRAGIDDPDLEPLWASMSGVMWKRTC